MISPYANNDFTPPIPSIIDVSRWFLNCYWLMEASIKNYKEYSKPSNYDEETIRMIEEQIQYNKQQYDSVTEKILDFIRE